jgi:hypothetical protein
MEPQEKQDITTGRQSEKTPILVSGKESMAEPLKPAPVKNESASTVAASILALWQTDFFDLQSLGLRVVILAKDNKLYASIEFPGHELAVSENGKKAILLDGKPVVEYE